MKKPSLLAQIVEEIQTSDEKAIPFRRFMELALYHSREGYYSRSKTKLGKKGDFFTNAHVGTFFAKCCTKQFMQWIQEKNPVKPWALIEWGAGDGRVLNQVLQELLKQGIHHRDVDVYLIESSPFHQQQSGKSLFDSPFTIKWVNSLTDIPSYSFAIIYSNELVDAFPVHRFRCEPGGFTECYITIDPAKKLKECFLPLRSQEIALTLEELGINAHNAYEFEICLEIVGWYQQIAEWMQSGYLMTVDYGGVSQELWQKRQGTVRYFYQHQMPSNPYQQLGEVDITCDVPFDWLIKNGEKMGLSTEFYGTQARFLMEAGILDLIPTNIATEDPFSFEAKQIRMIKQLIHPHTMGERFKVLVQQK